MRYACLNGGKRFRATLVYVCGELAGATLEQLDAAAAVVEMIHAYSLVHDDLPAMDDDDLRRGSPACHLAYDEATAILAGDALQVLAFEVLATAPALAIPDHCRLKMIATLAVAAGTRGMAGGQALDVRALEQPSNLCIDELSRIHRLKAGALICASARLGGITAQADDQLLASLDEYAANLGLAFQIVDDILDVSETSATLGKPSGADQRMQKVTYVSLLGLEKAKEKAQKLCENAIETIVQIGDNTTILQQLAHFVVNRNF